MQKTYNNNSLDKQQLMKIDEQLQRAEYDKIVALRALEARSLEAFVCIDLLMFYFILLNTLTLKNIVFNLTSDYERKI